MKSIVLGIVCLLLGGFASESFAQQPPPVAAKGIGFTGPLAAAAAGAKIIYTTVSEGENLKEAWGAYMKGMDNVYRLIMVLTEHDSEKGGEYFRKAVATQSKLNAATGKAPGFMTVWAGNVLSVDFTGTLNKLTGLPSGGQVLAKHRAAVNQAGRELQDLVPGLLADIGIAVQANPDPFTLCACQVRCDGSRQQVIGYREPIHGIADLRGNPVGGGPIYSYESRWNVLSATNPYRVRLAACRALTAGVLSAENRTRFLTSCRSRGGVVDSVTTLRCDRSAAF